MTNEDTTAPVAARSATDAADSLGCAGAVAFLTLADAEQQEAEAWKSYKEAEKQMYATPIGQQTAKLNSEWYSKQKLTEAIKTAERLGLRVAGGCSRSTVPCGQADHLRQVVAAGVQPTANEAY